MELKTMEYNLSVCKVTDISDIKLTKKSEKIRIAEIYREVI